LLLVDEAYIHFADVPSVVDLVAQGKDVIVLRTFSKIYGMAGIRCGLALGRPDLLARLQRYGMNAMPVTAIAAAHASLQDPTLVETRRKRNSDIRASTFGWLDGRGWKYTPGVSNCFMIDTGVPAKQVIDAMQKRNVYIGRVWPAVPNHVRISVGTPEEMARFQTAFAATMAELKPPARG
jgi:histidinol-phosphate aminotransferase